MIEKTARETQIQRRAFLRDGSLLLCGASLGVALPRRLFADKTEAAQPLRIGLVTDLHYADKPHAGSRYYRQSLDKLAEAGDEFQKQKLDFVVELGDLIDAADSVETELGYLTRINRDFSNICKTRHYVLGNHCVQTLKKEEFLAAVEQPKSYYSFDAGNFHFVVLDACFRSDGEPYGRNNFKWTDPNIPAAELEWLKADLDKTTKPTIVFGHQRLDVSNNHGVKNAVAVRKLFEDSQKVLAVFQGHSHKNDYHQIAGIHYCTMVAMVEGTGPENNGFSTMSLAGDGTITITGFRKQDRYEWPA
ncbi:metallophosphoesterase [Symmachiella dynata]|uniref:metallophosphoesterase n=1 Tax=Symmachiella dynata TaxID=2527995 RepID=UPI0030EE7E5E